jgi:hypothetical protein
LENQRASLALDPARPSYRNGRSGVGDLLTAAKRALILAKRALTIPRNRRSRCRETSVHDAAKHALDLALAARGVVGLADDDEPGRLRRPDPRTHGGTVERLEAAHYILIALVVALPIYCAMKARRAAIASERCLVSHGYQHLAWERLFRGLRKQAIERGEDPSLFEPPEGPPDERRKAP